MLGNQSGVNVHAFNRKVTECVSEIKSCNNAIFEHINDLYNLLQDTRYNPYPAILDLFEEPMDRLFGTEPVPRINKNTIEFDQIATEGDRYINSTVYFHRSWINGIVTIPSFDKLIIDFAMILRNAEDAADTDADEDEKKLEKFRFIVDYSDYRNITISVDDVVKLTNINLTSVAQIKVLLNETFRSSETFCNNMHEVFVIVITALSNHNFGAHHLSYTDTINKIGNIINVHNKYIVHYSDAVNFNIIYEKSLAIIKGLLDDAKVNQIGVIKQRKHVEYGTEGKDLNGRAFSDEEDYVFTAIMSPFKYGEKLMVRDYKNFSLVVEFDADHMATMNFLFTITNDAATVQVLNLEGEVKETLNLLSNDRLNTPRGCLFMFKNDPINRNMEGTHHIDRCEQCKTNFESAFDLIDRVINSVKTNAVKLFAFNKVQAEKKAQEDARMERFHEVVGIMIRNFNCGRIDIPNVIDPVIARMMLTGRPAFKNTIDEIAETKFLPEVLQLVNDDIRSIELAKFHEQLKKLYGTSEPMEWGL